MLTKRHLVIAALWILPRVAYAADDCQESPEAHVRLSNAIKRGNAAEVEAALQNGACVNGSDRDYVPLVQASVRCLVTVVDVLLRYGADPNRVQWWQGLPDDLALSTAIDSDCPIPLIAGLVEGGANVEGVARQGDRRPLELAIPIGNSLVIDMLVAHGAVIKPNALLFMSGPTYNYSGQKTPGTTVETVRKLIAAGADVHAMGPREIRPVHLAGDPDVLNLLLQKGADVAARTRNGETALWSKNLVGNFPDQALCASRRLLVEQGIDVNAFNRDGDTALISLMRIAPTDWPDQLSKGAVCAAQAIVDLSPTLEIDTVDYDGRSPLMYAAMWDHSSPERLDLLRALIARGADVNRRDYDGQSVLSYARDRDVRAILVEAGAI